MSFQQITRIFIVLNVALSTIGSPENSEVGSSNSALANYQSSYLDYTPGHSMSDMLNMFENESYSPEGLKSIPSARKRAWRLIRRPGKRYGAENKRAIRLIRLGKRDMDESGMDKRAIRLIRLGKRDTVENGLDKRAIRLIRLGKRDTAENGMDKRAIRLIRLGKRDMAENGLDKRDGMKKRTVYDGRPEDYSGMDKRAIRLIRLGKRDTAENGFDKRGVHLIRGAKRGGMKKRLFHNRWPEPEDYYDSKKGKPIIRMGRYGNY